MDFRCGNTDFQWNLKELEECFFLSAIALYVNASTLSVTGNRAAECRFD